uniref:UspA domain-containing protein n=2 Tax=Clytia hemisphaerica TaxID=252671 RepID=A0A7M5XC00_9CNID|eukprot:TCONS_00016497-protein
MSRLNCICVDESNESERAFEWYAANHHRTGDVVGIIHVHQMPSLPSMGLKAGSIPITEDYHHSIKKSVEKSNALMNKYKDFCVNRINCDYKVLLTDSHHSPGQLICEIAAKNDAAVIVMGQRGLSTFSRALLGSTSDYVLHHSDRPVIVVPRKE